MCFDKFKIRFIDRFFLFSANASLLQQSTISNLGIVGRISIKRFVHIYLVTRADQLDQAARDDFHGGLRTRLSFGCISIFAIDGAIDKQRWIHRETRCENHASLLNHA